MITFTANIRSASARSDDAITTSSVGIPVSLNLASEFAGLAKTIVFKAGTVSVDVALIGDATQATVPVDVLATSGVWLNVGIYAADSEGNVVIPTVWASAGLIQQGTVPSGVDPSEPTPSWVAQVQSIASEASGNAETALNKATAVEEAAARGDFDGRDGTDGFSPTVTVNEIPGGHEVIITDIDGEHPFDVMDGQGGGGGGAVDSVNGQTGTVVLDATDVGALPDTTTVPTKTSQLQNDSGFLTSAPVTSVNSKTGAVTLTASDVGAYVKPSGGIPATDIASGVIPSVPSAYTSNPAALGTASPGASTSWARGDHVHAKPTYTKSDVGLSNVDNVRQYSASNPPPYPVTSVNGQTGAVSLSIPSSASDVGAVAVAQGVAHAGEFVVVGSDGNVTTVTLATWQGGSY